MSTIHSQRVKVINSGLSQVKDILIDQNLQLYLVKHTEADIINTEQVLTYVPRWPLVVNILSAIMCLGLSSVYHLYNYYSRHVCYKLATFDYGGICMLIAGSAYPPIYYSFACQSLHTLRTTFLAILTLGACLVFAALCNEKLASNDWRKFKVGMFCCLGAAGIIPFVYIRSFEDTENASMEISL